jgi:hypothetical protein
VTGKERRSTSIFDVWNLRFLWSLDVGAWCFFHTEGKLRNENQKEKRKQTQPAQRHHG